MARQRYGTLGYASELMGVLVRLERDCERQFCLFKLMEKKITPGENCYETNFDRLLRIINQLSIVQTSINKTPSML